MPRGERESSVVAAGTSSVPIRANKQLHISLTESNFKPPGPLFDEAASSTIDL
jgi:hypothetical protein